MAIGGRRICPDGQWDAFAHPRRCPVATDGALQFQPIHGDESGMRRLHLDLQNSLIARTVAYDCPVRPPDSTVRVDVRLQDTHFGSVGILAVASQDRERIGNFKMVSVVYPIILDVFDI